LRLVKQWTSWANSDVDEFNRSLETRIAQELQQRRERLRQLDAGTGGLGIPIRGAANPAVLARPVNSPVTPVALERYDVALSFAGEDREYVEKVAEILRARGVKVFYDKFEKAELWGKNLIEHLAEIYQKRSRFVVMFISKHYVEKAWPKHERQNAQARALVAKEEYILPARFDDTEVPGMTSTVGYIALQGMTPEDFATLVQTKLG
jgi:hypothetical protein